MLKVKELRQIKGKRQDDVARYLNITRAAYTNIENNKRDPDSNVLLALADYFSVPMDDLFGRTIPYDEADYVHPRLIEMREKLGFSASEIAKKLNIPLSKYAQYEVCDAAPSLTILYKLADLYNVSIDYLVGKESHPALLDKKNEELTEVETDLINDFRSLNKQGKQYILQTMAMSVSIYKNDDLSNMDNLGKQRLNGRR